MNPTHGLGLLALFMLWRRIGKRIRPRGACRRERSRWSPAALSLHSAHWGAPRRPGLSSVPPSLTRCQTWRGKSRAGTARRYHWRLNQIAVKSVTQEMLPASGTTWNSECQSCVKRVSVHFISLHFTHFQLETTRVLLHSYFNISLQPGLTFIIWSWIY